MVEVNLLPQQYRKQSEPNLWMPAAVAMAVVTGLVVGAIEIATTTKINNLHRQIDGLNGEVAALTPVAQEYARLSQEKLRLEQVTAIATQLRDSKTYWSNDLAAFAAQLPRGGSVSVQSLTVQPLLDPGSLAGLQQAGQYLNRNITRQFDMSGSASNEQAMVNFLKIFETSPKFGVIFRGIQTDKATGKVTFSATIGYDGSTTAPPPTTPNATGTQGGGRVN